MNIDSLKGVWLDENRSNDERLAALYNVIWYGYIVSNPDSAFYFAEQYEAFSKSKKIEHAEATGLHLQAISMYYKSNYPKAVELYNKSLIINERLGNSDRVAQINSGIGHVYYKEGDLYKALDYYRKTEAIYQELGDSVGLATINNSIGSAYYVLKVYDKAVKHQKVALRIHERRNNKRGMADSYNNIGAVLHDQGLYDEAIPYYERGLQLRQEDNDLMSAIRSMNNIGAIYIEQGKYQEAADIGEETLKMSEESGSWDRIKNSTGLLADAYEGLGRHKEALKMYQRHISLRDSITNEENSRAIIEQAFQLDFQRRSDSLKAEQEKKDVIAQAEKDIAEKDAEKKNIIIGTGGGILLLILVFSGFVVSRLRITRRQKKVIEEQKEAVEFQKEQVEHKNREIVDSIQYAKRLQEAILPSAKRIGEHLPNSFVLYRPKDIVAGDFYWLEVVDGIVYFAAADCTGHGVPGAMVSVVCSNGLTKALVEEGIRTPAGILDRTRELVIDRFGRSENEVKDGMDISLCAFNSATKELHWAGAYNPLWIVRQDSEEVEEVKGDKQPVGKYAEGRSFTNHTLSLSSGDSLYIFSDGFPDQFGGPRGKKYKSGNFKKLLVSIANESPTIQREKLDQEFDQWRGDIEQIDDVCVIGVRL